MSPAATARTSATRRRAPTRTGRGAAARGRPAQRVPRRFSGPAKMRTAGAPATVLRPPLGLRLVDWTRGLPDRPLVDRIVRGRAWIFLIAILLMGLVATQVSLLKLNAGIGRAVERAGNLERRNGEMRGVISRLSREERIRAKGTELGLLMPDAGRITYLGVRGPGDPAGAAGALRAGRLGPAAGDFAVPLPVRPQAQQPAAGEDQAGVQTGEANQGETGEQSGAPAAAPAERGVAPTGGAPAGPGTAAGTEPAAGGTEPGVAGGTAADPTG